MPLNENNLEKQREHDLARFEAIIESSEDAIISKTLDGIVTGWNKAAQRIFGYTAEEMIGKPVLVLIPADRQDEEPAILERVRRGERIEHYETVRRRNNGELIDVSLTVSPIKDRTGKIIGASKIVRDITEFRRISKAQAFLATLVESADDAIVSKTLGGIVTSWNKAAERIFGYTADEMVGRSITRIIPPERQDEEPMIIGRLKKGDRLEHYETVRVRKDGRRVDISVTISPIRDGAGNIIGASKIARDVTEQKAFQQRLKNSEERFRVTLSSIGDAVIATDEQGRVTFMNAVAEQLTGYEQTEAAGKNLETVFDIINQLTRQAVDNPVAKVLREGKIVGMANHTVLKHKSGREIPIDDSAAPIEGLNKALHGVVLVFRDVTERYAAEAAQRQLAAIVESSSDAILSKNLEGCITSWNRAAQKMFGYFGEEVIGKHISILFPPDRLIEEQLIMDRIKRGERIEHYETIRVRKDGTQLHVSLAISPLKDSDGRVVGISKIVRDISQRKLAEQAMMHAQRELQQHADTLEKRVAERTAELQESNKFLEGLSYSIAHDLRAPLRGIRSFSQLLVDDFSTIPPEEAREHAKRIVTAATRMDTLISDLLAYGHLSHRDLPLSSVDPVQLAEKVIGELASDIQRTGARVEVRAPMPPVVANPTTLEQIFSNLISNALKFVKPGTTPQVVVFAERKGNRTRINVQDNGIGIEQEYYNKVFQIFERLESHEKYPGTGIGLAIVQKGVERMGGKAGVISAPGKGSTFWVELP
jgi:PAS domain S-box-containing protein